MSNVTIKTDMPVVQKQGMIDIPSKSGTKETHKLVILNNAGGCNSSGRDSIADFTPKYSLILANGDVVMDNLPLGEVSKGCIDLSNKTVPVITKDKCTLASGRYYLVVSYEGMSKKIAFKVAGGELDVATRDAVVIDTNGVLVEGKKYPFVKRALAGEKVPVYISSVADPCQGKESCSDALLMDVSSAAGRSYVLATDDDLNVYVKNSKGKFEILPSGSARTVGASGVDTVYVTVPLVAVNKAVETFHVGVAGSTMAAIDFVAPVIRFMKDATTTTEVVIGDDHSVERKVDTYYDFYLAAFMPGEDGTLSFCEECNFPLMLGSSTSSKLELKNDSIAIVKGHAKITLRSTKEYRTSKDASKRNPATIHIEGENPTLIVATFSPIYFRRAVSVKSVPHTSVQRTQATVKVLSSSAKAAVLIASTRQRASRRETSFFMFGILHFNIFYVQAFPASEPSVMGCQPFRAPIITPWLKYFCTKGYIVIIGSEDTTIAPYLIRFAFRFSSAAAEPVIAEAAISLLIRMLRITSCSGNLSGDRR